MKHRIHIILAFLLSAITPLWAQTYSIGDLIVNDDGSKGIVFYVTPDRTDGWMVALNDLPTHNWGLPLDIASLQNLSNPNALLDDTDGLTHTEIIRQYHSDNGYLQPYGAGIVDFEHGWYIPSSGQLMKLCSVLSMISDDLIRAGGSTLDWQPYFTSTESTSSNQIWAVDFGNHSRDWGGSFVSTAKSSEASFRAVRNILRPCETPEVEIQGADCLAFTFHGVTYNESGNYEQLVESPDGCDTLYHIAVSIGGTITHEWSQQACNHFVWNGTNYTEPGDYIQDFLSVDGCDSIVTLHLAFSDALEYDVDTAVCQSLWWNGQEYTEAGVYTQQFLDVDGCDSIVHLHLSFAGQPEGIPEIIGLTEVNVGTDLIVGQYYYHIDSVPLATHYEWTLEGADWIMDTTGTHCSLLITTPGTAILKVRAWNDCGETEQEIVIHGGFFDIDERQDMPVALYPNPANDKVIVEAEGIKSVKVYNTQGQLLKARDGEASNRVEISLQNIASGMYAVEVLTERGRVISKLTVTQKE